MTQPDLFTPRRTRLEREFEEFDQANPRVWELFVRFAREAIDAGLERFSADAILHRIRWETSVATRAARGGFKLNDHFSAFYARKFVARFPQFQNFFELRARRERAASQ